MDASRFLDVLRARVSGAEFVPVDTPDYPTLIVPRDQIVATVRALQGDPALGFTVVEITAADYLPRTPRFEVVYHLVRFGAPDPRQPGTPLPPARVRLKVQVPADEAWVPTLCEVSLAANWLEREVWDLLGIRFEGHPDLRRLLLLDDWEGHPLRKDYPVQVRVPYRSTEVMQLSEQEFVANIERQRQASGAAPRR